MQSQRKPATLVRSERDNSFVLAPSQDFQICSYEFSHPVIRSIHHAPERNSLILTTQDMMLDCSNSYKDLAVQLAVAANNAANGQDYPVKPDRPLVLGYCGEHDNPAIQKASFYKGTPRIATIGKLQIMTYIAGGIMQLALDTSSMKDNPVLTLMKELASIEIYGSRDDKYHPLFSDADLEDVRTAAPIIPVIDSPYMAGVPYGVSLRNAL